ncbi:MAG: hypothetical protein AAF467_27895 [Actinomycetota bacterium]
MSELMSIRRMAVSVFDCITFDRVAPWRWEGESNLDADTNAPLFEATITLTPSGWEWTLYQPNSTGELITRNHGHTLTLASAMRATNTTAQHWADNPTPEQRAARLARMTGLTRLVCDVCGSSSEIADLAERGMCGSFAHPDFPKQQCESAWFEGYDLEELIEAISGATR